MEGAQGMEEVGPPENGGHYRGWRKIQLWGIGDRVHIVTQPWKVRQGHPHPMLVSRTSSPPVPQMTQPWGMRHGYLCPHPHQSNCLVGSASQSIL